MDAGKEANVINEITRRIRRKLSVPDDWYCSIYNAGFGYLGINMGCNESTTTYSWAILLTVEDTAISEDKKMRVFMDLEEQPMRHLTDEEIVAKLQPFIDKHVNASPR